MIIPLDSNFLPTTEEYAVGYKVIPQAGIPYFVSKKPKVSEFSERARKKKRIYKRKKSDPKPDA
jgi:hypothetical protein